MRTLRVITLPAQNKQDYDSEFVPRIGERLVLQYATEPGPTFAHYFRVKDVAYHLDEKPENQVVVLVEEERQGRPWF
jgi:hypothetical protein